MVAATSTVPVLTDADDRHARQAAQVPLNQLLLHVIEQPSVSRQQHVEAASEEGEQRTVS